MASRRNGPQLSSRHDDDDDTLHTQEVQLNLVTIIQYRLALQTRIISLSTAMYRVKKANMSTTDKNHVITKCKYSNAEHT